MKIKITGHHTNGTYFWTLTGNMSKSDAENMLNSYDWSSIQATFDGYPLDPDSIQAELYDDEYIEPAEISRLKIELYRRGLLGVVESYMQNKNGEVRIWWENVKSVDFYHANVQQAIVDLQGMTVELAKDIFRSANLID